MGLAMAFASAIVAGCGSSQTVSLHAAASSSSVRSTSGSSSVSAVNAAAKTRRAGRRPHNTGAVDHYPRKLTTRWQMISRINGHPAMWIARRAGVTLVRMDQRFVHLALHAGSLDPGGAGWHYGDMVAGREIHHLVLGFNGGFKFNTAAGGFYSFGRTGVALSDGLGSIVTYKDGRTDIGAWHRGVPSQGRAIASVRQNLRLLIDHGQPDASVAACGASCWGATVGGAAVARSGLGIRSDGQLIWAAGEGLTVAQLAGPMVGAGVQRGVQLDINPDWVAGYLYVHHHRSGPTPIPVVPGQFGISGQLLAPYSRDFFTVLSN